MTGGGNPQRQAQAHRSYRWALLSLVPGLVAALGVLGATGMTVTPVPMLGYVLLVALLLAAHYLYSRGRPDPGLALVTGALALMIASAVLAGIIANAGLRLRYPSFDGTLAKLDRLAGIDTPGLVIWTAHWPVVVAILGAAYSSIFPLAFVSVVWLGIRQRAERVWELVLGFGASIQLAAIISIFAPALGNIVYARLGGLAGHGLPDGAGIYHLHAIAAYRDGAGTVLDVRHLEGVVTFPSFHMVMAIVVAWAFRGTGLGKIMACWCTLVAISTVPIGGHYVIDLAAGTLLWLGVMALGRRPVAGRPATEVGWPTSAAPEPIA